MAKRAKRKWRRKLIDVVVLGGKTHPARAAVSGLFAIHLTPGKLRGDYTLTHLPTGGAIERGMRTFGEAERLLARVEPLLDWSKLQATYTEGRYGPRFRIGGVAEKQRAAVSEALQRWAKRRRVSAGCAR